MSEISSFIDRYLPEIAAAIGECRTRLHALIPRGYELVYDNYNALVFGFGPTERSSEAVLSIAAYPKWVTLFFLQGKSLDDPKKRLEGSGSQVRSIRLSAPSDLDDPYVRGLISLAMVGERDAFADAAPLRTIVKSISAKQRPRRPPASARGTRPSTGRSSKPASSASAKTATKSASKSGRQTVATRVAKAVRKSPAKSATKSASNRSRGSASTLQKKGASAGTRPARGK